MTGMTAYNRDKSIQLINSIPQTREQELADQLAAAVAEIERQSTLLGLPALELARRLEDLEAKNARLTIAEEVAEAADRYMSASVAPGFGSTQLDVLRKTLTAWRGVRNGELATAIRISQGKEIKSA